MSKLLKALTTDATETFSIESLELSVETLRDQEDALIIEPESPVSLETIESAVSQLERLKSVGDYSFEQIRNIVATAIPVDTLYSAESDIRMTEQLYMEVSLESLKTMADKFKGWFINNAAKAEEHTSWLKESSKEMEKANKEAAGSLKGVNDTVQQVPVYMARRLEMDGEFSISKLTSALDKSIDVFSKVNTAYWKGVNDILNTYTKDILDAANKLGKEAKIEDVFKEADIQRNLSDFGKFLDRYFDLAEKNHNKYALPGNNEISFYVMPDRQTYVGNEYVLVKPGVVIKPTSGKKQGPRTVHADVTPADIKAIQKTQDAFLKFTKDIEKEAADSNHKSIKILNDFSGKIAKLKTSEKNISIIQGVTKSIVNSIFTTYFTSKWQAVKYMYNVNVALTRVLVETAKKAK